MKNTASFCPNCTCGRQQNNKPIESIEDVRKKIFIHTDEIGDSEILFPAGTCARIRKKISERIIPEQN